MPRRTIQQVLSQDPLFGSSPQTPPSDQTGPAAVQAAGSPPPPAAPDLHAPATTPAQPAPSSEPPTPSTRSKPRRARTEQVSTARVAVWVRPLSAQADRIAATGLPPQDVLKAAWRRVAVSFALAPDYVPPSLDERAEGREHCYATTLTVDAGILEGLVRAHDRLRIKSHWSLVCGQAEPLFWHALDDLLTELEQGDPA